MLQHGLQALHWQTPHQLAVGTGADAPGTLLCEVAAAGMLALQTEPWLPVAAAPAHPKWHGNLANMGKNAPVAGPRQTTCQHTGSHTALDSICTWSTCQNCSYLADSCRGTASVKTALDMLLTKQKLVDE